MGSLARIATDSSQLYSFTMQIRSVYAAAGMAVLLTLVYRTAFASFESASLTSWASSGRMANQHAVVSEVPPRPTWEEAQRFLHPMKHGGEPATVLKAAAVVAPTVSIGGIADQSELVASAVQTVVAAAATVAATTEPATTGAPATLANLPAWMLPEVSGRALALNEPAKHALAAVEPRGTTIHFTFGTSVMMDFVKNWLHFAQKAGL